MTRKTYFGPLVDVSFDLEICEHAAKCVKGMPEVFDTHKKPWINAEVADTPELAQKLREVIARCPSTALHIEEHEVCPVPGFATVAISPAAEEQ